METKFGTRLKAARKYRNITQGDLSEKVGIKQSALSYIEVGRNGTDEITAKALAKILGVSIEWLKGESDDSDIPMTEISKKSKDNSDQKFTERFIEVYTIIKKQGKFKTDAEFADTHDISRTTLSLALSKKAKINYEWITYLSNYGANKDYILDGTLPALKSESSNDSSPFKQNVLANIKNIRTQLDMLEEYVINSKHKHDS